MDVTHILWIDSSVKTCYERCSKNRSITRVEHKNIVAHQKKPKKIDFVIRNTGTRADLRKKIDIIAKKLITK